MDTPSTLIAICTGPIVFTFWIGANFVSSSLVKCGCGLEANLYLLFLHNSSFNWVRVSSGRDFCSADSSQWMEIKVSVQSGAGDSNVVRPFFSPQVTMTERDSPPASATEITFTWSSDFTPSNREWNGAWHAALIWSSCCTFSGAMLLDAECPVRPQLTQKVVVPCTSNIAEEILVIDTM